MSVQSFLVPAGPLKMARRCSRSRSSPRNVPLRSLLVENSVSAHVASDGVSLGQADLGGAFTAHVLNSRASHGFVGSEASGESTAAAVAGAGWLVGFTSRHCFLVGCRGALYFSDWFWRDRRSGSV